MMNLMVSIGAKIVKAEMNVLKKIEKNIHDRHTRHRKKKISEVQYQQGLQSEIGRAMNILFVLGMPMTLILSVIYKLSSKKEKITKLCGTLLLVFIVLSFAFPTVFIPKTIGLFPRGTDDFPLTGWLINLANVCYVFIERWLFCFNTIQTAIAFLFMTLLPEAELFLNKDSDELFVESKERREKMKIIEEKAED